MYGKLDAITAWLQNFDGGTDFLKRTDSGLGDTPLLNAAAVEPNGAEETVQTLLDAKANLHQLNVVGANVVVVVTRVRCCTLLRWCLRRSRGSWTLFSTETGRPDIFRVGSNDRATYRVLSACDLVARHGPRATQP